MERRNQDSAECGGVTLIGLDFGSTTTSLLAAKARIGINCATGRMAFTSPEVTSRSEPIFTPFDGQRINLAALNSQIGVWLTEAGIAPRSVFSGGAIVTGLAAERENAKDLAGLVNSLLGDAVIATADDPRLESWLAFMGSCSALSRAMPEMPILNLDIGGGTTNPALGLNGNVTATGCYFIGARHIQFEPGTYTISAVSRYGADVLRALSIAGTIGQTLAASSVARIVQYYVEALEAIVTGNTAYFSQGASARMEQAALHAAIDPATLITLSGGVGELVYAAIDGQPWPPKTHYGDLGIDLARGILASPRLSRDLHRAIPANKGRATVQGLTLHSTEISGTTLFLPSERILPLRDLPVLASLSANAGAEAIAAALRLAGHSTRGACLQIAWDQISPSLEGVRALAGDLAAALSGIRHADNMPLVILTPENVGKAIGNYTTGWQQSHHNLIVIDEIPVRNAKFVNLGRLHQGIVPVSFYGLAGPDT